jgi:hypothetical protein
MFIIVFILWYGHDPEFFREELFMEKQGESINDQSHENVNSTVSIDSSKKSYNHIEYLATLSITASTAEELKAKSYFESIRNADDKDYQNLRSQKLPIGIITSDTKFVRLYDLELLESYNQYPAAETAGYEADS